MRDEAQTLASGLAELLSQAAKTTDLISKARGNTKFSAEVVNKVVSGYRPKLEPLVDPIRSRLIEIADLASRIEETYRLSTSERSGLEEGIQTIELRMEIGELSEEDAESESAEARLKLENADDPPGAKELYEALDAARPTLEVLDTVLEAGLAAMTHIEPGEEPEEANLQEEPPAEHAVEETPEVEEPAPELPPEPPPAPPELPPDPPAPPEPPLEPPPPPEPTDDASMEFDVEIDLGDLAPPDLPQESTVATPAVADPADSAAALIPPPPPSSSGTNPPPPPDMGSGGFVPPPPPESAAPVIPPPSPSSSGMAPPPPMVPPPPPVGSAEEPMEDEGAATMAMPSLSALLDQLGGGGLGALGTPSPGMPSPPPAPPPPAEPPVHATAEFDSVTDGKTPTGDPVSDAAPLPARLILTQKDGTEEIYPFVGDVLSIGRGRNNDIQIRNDAKISRYHCRIFRNGNQYVVEDNRSSNGTIVNGEPIDTLPLQGGEQIIVGETPVLFQLG